MKESRSEILVKRYFENRIETKEIRKQITDLYVANGEKFYLTSHKENWLARGHKWDGWESAVVVSDNVSREELEMARLLDKKAALRSKRGSIQRAIYLEGRKLTNRDISARSEQIFCPVN